MIHIWLWLQFLSSSLENLVKNLGKDYFKYLSQEFDNEILDLVKQKGFYLYEYMTDFKKFKEQLPNKWKFYSSLIGKKWKRWKIITICI